MNYYELNHSETKIEIIEHHEITPYVRVWDKDFIKSAEYTIATPGQKEKAPEELDLLDNTDELINLKIWLKSGHYFNGLCKVNWFYDGIDSMHACMFTILENLSQAHRHA